MLLVWLGNEAENSDLVFESLATHSKRAEATPPAAASNDLIAPLRRSDVSLAMAGLCSRPYWRRTWIMQEIVLAAEIVLHCGLCRIEWDVLADVLRTLGQWKEEEVVTGLDNASVDVREYWTIIANSQATRLVLQRDSGVRETDLLKLVERYRDMECTDSRDRIYGLFGLLAPGALGMNANYAVSAFGLFLTVMDTFTPLQPVRIGHLLYEVLGLRDYEHTIRAIVARRTVQLGTVKISTHLVGTVVKSAAAPLSTGPRIRRYSFAFSTILSYGGIITEGPSLVSSSAIGCYTKRLLRTSDKVFQIGDTDIVIVHSPGNGPGTHDDREPFLHYGLIFRGERAVDFHQKYEPYMDQFFDEVDRSFVDDRAFVVRVLENYQAIRLETATFLQAIGLGGDCFDVREWKWPLSSEAAELKMTLCAQGTVNSER